MFSREEIEERFERFVLVRLWTNDPKPEARSEEWRELLEHRFGTTAIPYYATLRPDGTTLEGTGFPGGSLDAFAGKIARMLDAALGK